MNVAKLKELLKDAPDEMKVLIPANPNEGFDGVFLSPCEKDSGELEMGTEDLTAEDEEEMTLLGKEIPSEKSFVLVPCGFYEDHDNSHELN